MFENLLHKILKLFRGKEENRNYNLENVKNILVVRQHNQLGDLLISSPVFRALKEKFPDSHLTAIVSPANYKALQFNPFVDRIFVFEKNKLLSNSYRKEFNKVLKSNYDLAVVPAVTSLSFTSDLIAGLSDAKIKIGVNSLDGTNNKSSYFFDRRIVLDWREKPDTHVSQRNLDILLPFGIETKNLSPIIKYTENENNLVLRFIERLEGDRNTPIIGLHIGAGKIQNRWDYRNYAELIKKLESNFNARIYLSGGGESDEILIKNVYEINRKEYKVFREPGMSNLAALIKNSNLFITNDTGPMHAAASVETPTISLFGPTNPKMWAPLGENKIYIKKDEDINSISVDDVYNCSVELLSH